MQESLQTRPAWQLKRKCRKQGFRRLEHSVGTGSPSKSNCPADLTYMVMMHHEATVVLSVDKTPEWHLQKTVQPTANESTLFA